MLSTASETASPTSPASWALAPWRCANSTMARRTTGTDAAMAGRRPLTHRVVSSPGGGAPDDCSAVVIALQVLRVPARQPAARALLLDHPVVVVALEHRVDVCDVVTGRDDEPVEARAHALVDLDRQH